MESLPVRQDLCVPSRGESSRRMHCRADKERRRRRLKTEERGVSRPWIAASSLPAAIETRPSRLISGGSDSARSGEWLQVVSGWILRNARLRKKMKMSPSTLRFLTILAYITGISCTIDYLELVMPRYAILGGDVILKCNHSVRPEQLYKVEWRKGDRKIFQYIKGRKPPFRYFPAAGVVLNEQNSNQKQIQLSKLDFAASGTYFCVVTTDAPIFMKESETKDLTVIEPQDGDPEITFNKSTYEVGDILKANCTTAFSKPPPHITWFINDEKVIDRLTKSFSNGMIHGHGYFEQKSFSIKQLSVEVSDLHVGADGRLTLTCISTIPGYVQDMETYADKRSSTVQIDIELTEGPVGEAISNINPNSTSWRSTLNISLFSLSILASRYIV